MISAAGTASSTTRKLPILPIWCAAKQSVMTDRYWPTCVLGAGGQAARYYVDWHPTAMRSIAALGWLRGHGAGRPAADIARLEQGGRKQTLEARMA